jgi:hypothetical protein
MRVDAMCVIAFCIFTVLLLAVDEVGAKVEEERVERDSKLLRGKKRFSKPDGGCSEGENKCRKKINSFPQRENYVPNKGRV